MFMFSPGSAIAPDAFVHVVDAFVDTIDLKSSGFAHVERKGEGYPPYPPASLMKLFLYGYRYGIRATRKLEQEAKTVNRKKKCSDFGRMKYSKFGNKSAVISVTTLQ
jgi:transposase